MNTDTYLYIIVFKKRVVVHHQSKLPLFFTHSQLAHIKHDIVLDFCVGTYQTVSYHVVELTNLETIDQPHLMLNLRQLLGQVDEGIWWVLSRGMQLLEWHHSHPFCSRCGSQTEQNASEYSLVCVTCQHVQYPRINPCIMVLITDGNKVLLAKSSRPNVEHYSLIAGFIEAGESAEEAVHREVNEEVGLQLKNLKYVCSQSWPFPHSLMLGFCADYLCGSICIDTNELTDAKWFVRSDISSVMLPDTGTLSRKLINAWLAGDY